MGFSTVLDEGQSQCVEDSGSQWTAAGITAAVWLAGKVPGLLQLSAVQCDNWLPCEGQAEEKELGTCLGLEKCHLYLLKYW